MADYDYRIAPPEAVDSSMMVKESYFEPEWIELEKKKLWPKVWQMACRVEEVPKVGDFVTYNIADESIIVVRSSADEIKAYYNVCQHRGRRLTSGCGHTTRLYCPFHGWQWKLDGTNINMTDHEDWGDNFDRSKVALKPVKVDSWGGWVFINMDPDAEPLMEFLGEAARILAPFELEKMRYGWRKWMIIKCNWKIALEAFNEGYHVRTTHQQTLDFSDNRSASRSYGIHSMFGYPETIDIFGTGSHRLGNKREDIRAALGEYYRMQKADLNSIMTDTLLEVSQKLVDTLPEGTPPEHVLGQMMMDAIAADAARGVEWPTITQEQFEEAGTDWHIFPNMILLQSHTNCLGYRARPNGDDPNSCIFEVFHMERYPEGQEPKVENIRNDDFTDADFWGRILIQDFVQMQETHAGQKSAGFSGAFTNPRQEGPLRNFHRVYHEYLGK